MGKGEERRKKGVRDTKGEEERERYLAASENVPLSAASREEGELMRSDKCSASEEDSS